MTGDVLNNGAVELLRNSTDSPNWDIILAVYGAQFVTWLQDTRPCGLTMRGNYHGTDLQAAFADYNERN